MIGDIGCGVIALGAALLFVISLARAAKEPDE
jgi:hypothetical protein